MGSDLGVASWVNMTRAIFDAMTVLDDGGSGNVVVRLSGIVGLNLLALSF